MDTPTFENLFPRGGTGRSIHVSGQGRNKKFVYRRGMMCGLGDLEIEEWKALVKQAIANAGEQELYQHLLRFVTEHYAFCHSTSEREQKALELHASRIFDNPLWVNYVAFNTASRPDVLKKQELVTVVSDCCKKPGQITKERFLRDGSTYTPCPHCGRWTSVQVVTEEDKVIT